MRLVRWGCVVLLILRPEPGASATAARAAAMGLQTVMSPLFQVRPIAWEPPDASGYDALMLTSVNAVTAAGPALRRYVGLPCYCVGETTASAARAAGLDRIEVGPSDLSALLAVMAIDGIGTALWLCGQDRTEIDHPAVRLDPHVVYAAEPSTELDASAIRALRAGAVPLIHSPRAGRLFAELVDRAGVDRAAISVAAISSAAAQALGRGWRNIAHALHPRDQALLELAAKLCKTGPTGGGDGNE